MTGDLHPEVEALIEGLERQMEAEGDLDPEAAEIADTARTYLAAAHNVDPEDVRIENVEQLSGGHWHVEARVRPRFDQVYFTVAVNAPEPEPRRSSFHPTGPPETQVAAPVDRTRSREFLKAVGWITLWWGIGLVLASIFFR